MHYPNCLFCKIVAGEIPCRKAHEDGDVLAFHDIRPLAPVHVLVIPKKHIATMYDCAPGDEAVLGRMLALAPVIARSARRGVPVVLTQDPTPCPLALGSGNDR